MAQKSTNGGEAKTRGQKRKAEEMGGPALAPVADRDGGSPPPEKRVTRAVAARKKKEEDEEKEKTKKAATTTRTTRATTKRVEEEKAATRKKVERKTKNKIEEEGEQEQEKSAEVRKRKRGGEEAGEGEAVAVGDAEELGVGGAPETPASAPSGRTAAKAGQRKGTSVQSRAKKPTRSAEGPPAKKKRILHKLLRPGVNDKIGFSWWREETEPETEEEEEEKEAEEELRGRKRKAEDGGEFGRWVKRSRADSLEVLVELGDEEQEEREGQGSVSSRKQRTPPSFQRYEYSDEVKRASLPMADPLSDSRFQKSHNKSRANETRIHKEESQKEDEHLGKYLELWDDLGKVAHDDDKCFEVLGVDVPTSQLGRRSLLRKKRRLFRELEEIATRGRVYKEERRRARLEEGDEERLEVTYASHLRRTEQSPLKLRGRTIERQHWRKV